MLSITLMPPQTRLTHTRLNMETCKRPDGWLYLVFCSCELYSQCSSSSLLLDMSATCHGENLIAYHPPSHISCGKFKWDQAQGLCVCCGADVNCVYCLQLIRGTTRIRSMLSCNGEVNTPNHVEFNSKHLCLCDFKFHVSQGYCII